MCQTVVDTKKRTQLKKGCKERHACKAGPQGGSGKCVFCCTGPDCDLDPVSKFPRECGAEYTTFNQTLNRRKRSLTDCRMLFMSCVNGHLVNFGAFFRFFSSLFFSMIIIIYSNIIR